MHNTTESWEESDSFVPCYWKTKCNECEVNQNCAYYFENGGRTKKDEFIGPKDHHLMNRLCDAGTDHSKFMRMIVVCVDVTAPLYWWNEFNTYTIGTAATSGSTIQKIADKEFTLEDFSCEHLENSWRVHLKETIKLLNDAIGSYHWCNTNAKKNGGGR